MNVSQETRSLNVSQKHLLIAYVGLLYNKGGKGAISEAIRCDDMTFRIVTDWHSQREIAFKGMTLKSAVLQGNFTVEAFRSGRWTTYHEVSVDDASLDVLKMIAAWMPCAIE